MNGLWRWIEVVGMAHLGTPKRLTLLH
jgi:hypothetical protein